MATAMMALDLVARRGVREGGVLKAGSATCALRQVAGLCANTDVLRDVMNVKGLIAKDSSKRAAVARYSRAPNKFVVCQSSTVQV